MKKNILLRIGAMGKITLLLFAAFMMTACDNGEDPDPIVIPPDEEDTRVKEVWEMHQRYNGEIYHTLRLTFYPEEKRYFVKQEPHTNGMYLFESDYYEYYDIINDTIFLKFEEDSEFDPGLNCCKFLIEYISNDTMEWKYLGVMNGQQIGIYTFSLVN